MEAYPVDREARQIVRWLMEEQRRGTLHLNIAATRSHVVEVSADSLSQRLGEETGRRWTLMRQRPQTACRRCKNFEGGYVHRRS